MAASFYFFIEQEEKINMKRLVDANDIYVVVETNTINSNVTLTPFTSYSEAQACFRRIREEYLADAGDKPCIIDDWEQGFSVHMTDDGDYDIAVQLIKLW